MSIRDLILDRLRTKMLYPLTPRALGTSPIRAMFVSESLWHVLNSPVGDDEWEKRVGELQADLERFVDGQPITPKYLFLLYPSGEGVWEIRSVQNEPSIRVLGLFSKKDVFIATNHALRADLGGWQSREWKMVKREARRIWTWLFHTYLPVITTDVNNVVNGAIDAKYFKE